MAVILVVDDEIDLRELVATVLADAGHAVLTAQDGSEAIDVIERTPTIDLLFTDLVMPRMDGIELGDIARARRPGIKILYTTGYMDFARSRGGSDSIHGPIIGKPYRPSQLMQEITRLLA